MKDTGNILVSLKLIFEKLAVFIPSIHSFPPKVELVIEPDAVYIIFLSNQLEEVKLLRQSLNVIQITGASAQFVANLQIKLDNEISQIEVMLIEETKKASKSK